MKIKKYLFITLVILLSFSFKHSFGIIDPITIGVVKYNGGDWYSCINAVRNFIKNVKKNTNLVIQEKPVVIDLKKSTVFQYPLIIINGHGKILLNSFEKEMLKNYLLNGGFLLANDDFGMDKYFRQLMKEIFPEKKLIPLPLTHKLFKSYYKLNYIPKIHKHSGKNAQALAIIINKKISVLYLYESDILDGWEKASVHNVPKNKRLDALKFGINILHYILIL